MKRYWPVPALAHDLDHDRLMNALWDIEREAARCPSVLSSAKKIVQYVTLTIGTGAGARAPVNQKAEPPLTISFALDTGRMRWTMIPLQTLTMRAIKRMELQLQPERASWHTEMKMAAETDTEAQTLNL